MSLKIKKLLLKVCWQYLAKQSTSRKKEAIPLHHMHMQTHAGLEIMVHDTA
jgi:hypothetical protein